MRRKMLDMLMQRGEKNAESYEIPFMYRGSLLVLSQLTLCCLVTLKTCVKYSKASQYRRIPL
jgi:hypothetical protein